MTKPKTLIPEYRKLDLTDCKFKGLKLLSEINNRFMDTQRLVIRPFPGHLYVTAAQLTELARINGVPVKFAHMIKTIGMKNGMVMEIHLKGAKNG